MQKDTSAEHESHPPETPETEPHSADQQAQQAEPQEAEPQETRAEAEEARPEPQPAGTQDTGSPLQEQVQEMKDRWLRAEAELKNFRRRAEKDKADAAAYAMTAFARDLVTVADYLRMALDSMPQEVRQDDRVKTFVTGVEMTEKELLAGLSKHGITPIVPDKEPFDPNRHQAMSETDAVDVPPGHVVQTVKTGYMLKDRLLRPALVVVAKAPGGDRSARTSVDQEV
ncbi:MAG: nucleotide exchange factor GrpE [Rhodothalassiaceae bacterium]